MTLPVFGTAHESLARFDGFWTGAGEVFPNPWGYAGPVTGHWSFHRQPGGLVSIHDYGEQRGDAPAFYLHGIFAVDPASEEILWYSFDSIGFPPTEPSRGRWNGDSLTLVKRTPRGIGRSVFRLDGEVMHYEVEARPNGQEDFLPVMRGGFRRR